MRFFLLAMKKERFSFAQQRAASDIDTYPNSLLAATLPSLKLLV
jgi:hypothetical protein